MLVHIRNVLTQDEVKQCLQILQSSTWADGKATAGIQSAEAKHNLQLPESSDTSRQLGELVLKALGRTAEFHTAALPQRVFPPLFNRYDVGMKFDAHVDNAIRFSSAARVSVRTDLSATLFLSAPDDYDGGELVVRHSYGEEKVKLPAGDMVLYPAGSLHSVTPVIKGSRWASFFWIQSMVRGEVERALLYDFDIAIRKLAAEHGQNNQHVLSMTATYHNLLRLWANT